MLVRVGASSVNPVDNAVAAGRLREMAEHELPVILGRDYAGVVEEVGSEVTAFSAGDEVFGFVGATNPAVHDGTWAEFIVVPESRSIARKPDAVELATAGAAPLAAVTAMQRVDALELSAGDTVLIAGAAGGVGSFAVQLAAAAGATVLAPGLPEDENYLRELGVAEILPREGSVVDVVGQSHPEGVDAVVDLVNFEPGTYDSILKPAGRLSSPTNAAGTDPGRTNVMASAAPETLGAVAEQLDAGTLTVHIQRTFNLAEAPEALDALRTGHTQGKLAVRLI